MDFKKVICLAGFLAASSAPVWADGNGYVASVTHQLKAQGYEITQISKTFLGRVRFEAKRKDIEREIVINPRTGEVLRDLNRTVLGAVVVVVPVEQPELPTTTAVTDSAPEASKDSGETADDSSENTGSNDAGSDAAGDSGSGDSSSGGDGSGGDGSGGDGSGGDGSGGGDGSD